MKRRRLATFVLQRVNGSNSAVSVHYNLQWVKIGVLFSGLKSLVFLDASSLISSINSHKIKHSFAILISIFIISGTS
jgi:hypothetical protein